MKCLIRKWALGDVLWMEPVIRQLSSRLPALKVYSKYNSLFDNYPLYNVVFENKFSQLREVLYRAEDFLGTHLWYYPLQMAYEKNPNQHILHAYQNKLKLPLTTEYPNPYLNEPEKLPVIQGKYLVLHIESFAANHRKVYGVDWNVVVKYFRQMGYQIVQIGLQPLPLDNVYNFTGTLRQMISVIYNAHLFIGLDSGPSHIAASLHIPGIIFFGSVNPLYRHFPQLRQLLFLQRDCEFAGCYHQSVSVKGVTCRIAGDAGIPPCSRHDTFQVIFLIEAFIKQL